jgi:hypothetical protein
MNALFLLSLSPALQTSQPPFEPSVWGLELPVRDVATAARAYVDGLDFGLVQSGGEVARLEKDGLCLVLVRSDAPPAPEGAAGVHLTRGARPRAGAGGALAAGFVAPDWSRARSRSAAR